MTLDEILKQDNYRTLDELGEKINEVLADDLGKLVAYTGYFLLFYKDGNYTTYDETFRKINDASADKLGDLEKALGVSMKFKGDVFTYDVNFEIISKNNPKYYYRIGTGLVPEGIFERFPELIPAVGEYYYSKDGRHKKLMIVGESNYFGKELASESVFQDAEQWYKGKDVGLIPKSKSADVSNWKEGSRTFNKVYNKIGEVLAEHNIEYKAAGYEIVFYNYFLRPALNQGVGSSKKFIPQEIDCEVAGVALKEIISRLELDIVIFVSAKAFDAFNKFLGNDSSMSCSIHKVSHPSSMWWNKSGGKYGKGLFKDLLEKHYIIQ